MTYQQDYQRLRPKAETECLNPYCDRRPVASGYCNTHYKRLTRRQDPDAPPQRRRGVAIVQLSSPRLTEDDAQLLEKIAGERGITQYRLMTEILEEWLAQARKFRPAAKKP